MGDLPKAQEKVNDVIEENAEAMESTTEAHHSQGALAGHGGMK